MAVGDHQSVENWAKTISSKATTPEGKLYTAQLSSVISFYNKTPDAEKIPEVNWEDWSNRINTKGLVDKIMKNTEALLNEKYNVEAVANKLGGEYSDDYTRIVGLGLIPVRRAAIPLHSVVHLL